MKKRGGRVTQAGFGAKAVSGARHLRRKAEKLSKKWPELVQHVMKQRKIDHE